MRSNAYRRRGPLHMTLDVLVLVFMAQAPHAFSQQGIVEDCEIESFDYEDNVGRTLISGTATCSEARLEMTIFDDTTGERIGSDFTYIMDGQFELFIQAPAPEAIMIEYNIE